MIQENSNIRLKNWELVSVNPSDKKWDWTDLFCFWGNNIQTIIGFSLIASLYLVYSLNFFVVLFLHLCCDQGPAAHGNFFFVFWIFS